MKKGVILIFMFLFSLTFALASDTIHEREPATINEPYYFSQPCASCTYLNFTAMTRDGIFLANQPMTYNGSGVWVGNITTNTLQRYDINGQGDQNNIDSVFAFYFESTETGDTFDLAQGVAILGHLGLILLLFGIGTSFNSEKRWKLRSFFNILALLMAIVLLNSIRIIIGTSNNLKIMGTTGLIIGIVSAGFMIAWFLIHTTIEAFLYFKRKNIKKWEVSNDPY